jgi:hypothetical protein
LLSAGVSAAKQTEKITKKAARSRKNCYNEKRPEKGLHVKRQFGLRPVSSGFGPKQIDKTKGVIDYGKTGNTDDGTMGRYGF